MSEKKPVLRKILEHPVICFMLGMAIMFLLLKDPFILLGIMIVIGMVLYAFRDRIDLTESLGIGTPRVKLKPCEECGSTTKHKKSCSHYGKGKAKDA